MKFFFCLIAVPLFLSAVTPRVPPKNDKETPQYIIDYNAGLEAEDSRNWQEAITAYERSLQNYPDFPEALNNLGFCYCKMATMYLDKAGKAYKKALRLQPEHAELIESQGRYYVMRGELESAYKNYRKLTEIDTKKAEDLQDALDRVLEEAKEVLKVHQP